MALERTFGGVRNGLVGLVLGAGALVSEGCVFHANPQEAGNAVQSFIDTLTATHFKHDYHLYPDGIKRWSKIRFKEGGRIVDITEVYDAGHPPIMQRSSASVVDKVRGVETIPRELPLDMPIAVSDILLKENGFVEIFTYKDHTYKRNSELGVYEIRQQILKEEFEKIVAYKTKK